MTTLPKFPLLEVEDPKDKEPERNHEDLILVTLAVLEKAKINKTMQELYLNEALRVESEEIRAVTERWVTVKQKSHLTLVEK